MQLVFVHGVATRRELGSDAYDEAVAKRRRCFADWCFEGAPAVFRDPYWGDLGAHADRGFASIPKGPDTAFALGSLDAPAAAEGALEGTALIAAARKDFGGLLNSLALVLAQSDEAGAERRAEAIGAYAASREGGEAGEPQPPAWLGQVRSDAEFLDRLDEEVAGPGEAVGLGLGSVIRKAGKRVLGGLVDLVDGPIERAVRAFTPNIAQFLGDVFIYLKDGDRRARIRARIADDLVAAARDAGEQDRPLVVIGHSMGAIILYDMLSDRAFVTELEARIGAPLKIDLFLTVGTQIGLFEELDLFAHSRPGATPGAPRGVARWWHVYNVMDVLSFGVKGVIDGARQFSVNTRANIIEAHGAYFVSPVFHKRLRKRLVEEGLL